MTSVISPCMYTAPPCVYKRGRRALSLSGSHSPMLSTTGRTHTRSSEPRYWHLSQSSPPLAETWELPSLSRLACTPYYRHPRCKIVQCTRTPLLVVRPRGRNQDKPVCSCVTSCINHLGLGHAASLLVSARPPGQDTDKNPLIRTAKLHPLKKL